MIDSMIRDISVIGVLVDSDGTIVQVSDGWKRTADKSGFTLRNYGVGQNYLKYCVFSEIRSLEMLRGLKSVLDRTADCFSTIYPCKGPDVLSWFLLVAFAAGHNRSTSIVLHLDVSELLPNRMAPSASMVGVGPAATDHLHKAMAATVRRSIADALSSPESRPTGQAGTISAADQKKLSRLTENQLNILGELAKGATNAAIAKARGISLNSAKTQTAALIRKLGLENRTQAALFAARIGAGPN